MPIITSSAFTVASAEIDRVNKLLTENEAKIVAQAAQIAQLQAILANPTPVPAPAPTRAGLYVDGGLLKTRTGNPVVLRAVELMVNNDVKNRGYAALLKDIRDSLHANAVSPLFQGDKGSIAEVKAFLDAATGLGMIVGVNADHQSNGRAWLCAPDMVKLLNSYTNVYLECEVETDQTTSGAQWATDAKGLVKAVRDAGHLHPIKAGAPLGGRMVKYPLAKGAEVLAADPLKNTLFTFQCYWKSVTTGWQYSEDNGFPAGLQGAGKALDACSASGLCFIPGFDCQDDIGLTNHLALIEICNLNQLSCAFWVLFGDGMYPANNLVTDWRLNVLTPTGTALAAAFAPRGQLAVGL